jgi:hypothetical protein
MLKQALELIQSQEQYPPYFKAIQDAYASNVGMEHGDGVNETHFFVTTIEEDYSTLNIIAKPEVEIIAIPMKPFGLRGEHYI